MPSIRKWTNFESIQRRKSTMLLNVIFCSNELQHLVGKQISLSITNDIIILSPNQPNVPRIWRNLDYKCTMTLLRRFWSFSQKIIKQIVHPIYRISQLNVLYRIEKTCPIHSPNIYTIMYSSKTWIVHNV